MIFSITDAQPFPRILLTVTKILRKTNEQWAIVCKEFDLVTQRMANENWRMGCLYMIVLSQMMLELSKC